MKKTDKLICAFGFIILANIEISNPEPSDKEFIYAFVIFTFGVVFALRYLFHKPKQP